MLEQPLRVSFGQLRAARFARADSKVARRVFGAPQWGIRSLARSPIRQLFALPLGENEMEAALSALLAALVSLGLGSRG